MCQGSERQSQMSYHCENRYLDLSPTWHRPSRSVGATDECQSLVTTLDAMTQGTPSWRPGRRRFVLLVAQLVFVGGAEAWAPGTTSVHAAATTDHSGLTAVASDPVSLSGWLNVIWNGGPRVMLVDDRGMATRLVIDEALLRALGGTRGINGRRATITGERVENTPRTVRVLSINLEANDK
jgi:hypothetical protein